jgi:hypothetical protein
MAMMAWVCLSVCCSLLLGKEVKVSLAAGWLTGFVFARTEEGYKWDSRPLRAGGVT